MLIFYLQRNEIGPQQMIFDIATKKIDFDKEQFLFLPNLHFFD